jgi:hypothetical protein
MHGGKTRIASFRAETGAFLDEVNIITHISLVVPANFCVF